MKLLLAEDERELSRALVALLRHNNYTVDAVYNGTDALDWAKAGDYDGIILDVMMPGKNGFEVLRELRGEGNRTPVLILTARSEVDDRITGLDIGADDYLPKPFATGELLARIRAMLRRKEDYTPDILSFGDLRLDRGSFELSCGGKSVRLGGKEFQMMEMLMETPRRVVSADRFMEHIWGWDSEAEMNVVWVYVSYLRRRLAALDSGVEIRATRGQGYSLEEKG